MDGRWFGSCNRDALRENGPFFYSKSRRTLRDGAQGARASSEFRKASGNYQDYQEIGAYQRAGQRLGQENARPIHWHHLWVFATGIFSRVEEQRRQPAGLTGAVNLVSPRSALQHYTLDGGRDSSESHQPYRGQCQVKKQKLLCQTWHLSYKRRLASGLQRNCQLASCTTQASDGSHPPPTNPQLRRDQGHAHPCPLIYGHRALTKYDGQQSQSAPCHPSAQSPGDTFRSNVE